MNKIWTVEQGCYSEYRVVGIYDSEETAKRMAEYVASISDTPAEVKERTLNPGMGKLNEGLSLWEIDMDGEGNVRDIYATGPMISEDIDVADWQKPYITKYGVSGTIWAKDATHAIKIANEKRIMYLAQAINK